MNKYYFFLIILFSIILLIKCAINEKEKEKQFKYFDDDDEDEDDDPDFIDDDGYRPFREALKKYLNETKLIDSDKLIKPKRMRKIFLETVGDLDTEGIPEHIKKLYEELADYFVEQYYSKKKQIRGKDVYKLFKWEEISMKFNELIQANPYYGDEDKFKDQPDPNFPENEPDFDL